MRGRPRGRERGEGVRGLTKALLRQSVFLQKHSFTVCESGKQVQAARNRKWELNEWANSLAVWRMEHDEQEPAGEGGGKGA